MEVEIMKKLARLIIICASMALLTSCAFGGTVKGMIGDPGFQAENQPIRTVRVAVFTDGSRTDEAIERLLKETSESLKKQVGITFVPVSRSRIIFRSRERVEMLNELYQRTLEISPADGGFDIAVAVTSYNAADDLIFLMSMLVPLPDWIGCIDDTYRRFIITKSLDKNYLIHEVFHAFMFEHNHSSAGVMQAAKIRLLPFLPAFNSTEYLTAEDRKLVLKHKFRGFGGKVRVGLAEDVIREKLANK
jgi:hypothetical protein